MTFSDLVKKVGGVYRIEVLKRQMREADRLLSPYVKAQKAQKKSQITYHFIDKAYFLKAYELLNKNDIKIVKGDFIRS